MSGKAGHTQKGKSGSGLFLMEMIVAVFFFMLCASTCILAFAKSDHMSRSAKNLNQGILAAESTAEVFKVYGTEGLEEMLAFEKESENVYTAQFDDYGDGLVIRVELSDDGEGIEEAAIHVRLKRPSLADREEVFLLNAKRYVRVP